MSLFDDLSEYGRVRRPPPAEDLPTPELGHSLSLFHLSLVEAGMEHNGPPEDPRITAPASALGPIHLSHFVVAFLPFNDVTEKTAVNEVLFDLYTFFDWMDKNGMVHGLQGVSLNNLIRRLSAEQERCLNLSDLLDEESGRVLDSQPKDIASTLSDLFRVEKIEDRRLILHSLYQNEPVRLKLPTAVIDLARTGDHLDLTLGDTTDQWLVLEAGKVFPAASETR